MKKYEALFIFPETLKDEDLESTLQGVLEDVRRAGGEVKDIDRMGKRAFSRPMKKQEAGHYVLAHVLLDPAQVAPLLARYRLNESLFRVQLVTPSTAVGTPARLPAAPDGGGTEHAQS